MVKHKPLFDSWVTHEVALRGAIPAPAAALAIIKKGNAYKDMGRL